MITIELYFDYEGKTAEYENEEFPCLPNVGDIVMFNDEENNVELNGEVVTVMWDNPDGKWKPSVFVKVTDTLGDGSDSYWDDDD